MFKKTNKIKTINVKFLKIYLTVLIFVFVFVSVFNNIEGVTVNQMQNQSTDLKNQVTTNEQKIASLEEQAKSYLTEIDNLNKEIDGYNSELNKLQVKIDAVNKKIETYESNLQNSAQQYNSAKELYETRLRAIYENGIPNVMDLLVTSNGIADFFSRMNVYSSVIEYDQSLIGNIQNEKEYTDKIKKEIENEKLQIEQLNYDKEKTSASLSKAKKSKETKVAALNSSKEKLEAVNKILNSEAEALDKKVAEEIARQQAAAAKAAAEAAARAKAAAAKNSSNNTNTTQNISTGNGTFTWPTPGHTRLTATLPYYPSGERHTGIDVGTACGTPVYASCSGMIIRSNYYLTGDYDGDRSDGYGNTVWISDGTYTVIYGHLQYRKIVNYGDYVQKGQLVGYTASTGYSTGPHLHFEIRKNGTAINPMQFF